MTEIGNLVVRLKLDTTDYDQLLNQYKSKTDKFGQNLSTSLNLKPTVDHSALTALNKYLDLKKRHFGELQRYFNNNPLKPRVDTSELKKLDSFKTLFDRNQSVKLNVSANFDTTNLEKSIEQAITSGFKKTQSKGLLGSIAGFAGNLITSPIRGIGKAGSKALEGAFLGLGETLTKELSQGISEGISVSVSPLIGSFNLVGSKSAKAFSDEFIKVLGKDLKLVQNVFADLVGVEDILAESGAVRGNARKKKATNRLAAIRYYEDERASLDTTELAKEQERLFVKRPEQIQSIQQKISTRKDQLYEQKGVNRAQELLKKEGGKRDELIQRRESVDDQINTLQISLPRIQSKEDRQKIAERLKGLKQYKQSIEKALFRNQKNTERLVAISKKAVDEITNELEPLTKQLEKVIDDTAIEQFEFIVKKAPIFAGAAFGELSDPRKINSKIRQRESNIAKIQSKRNSLVSTGRSEQDKIGEINQSLSAYAPGEKELLDLQEANRKLQIEYDAAVKVMAEKPASEKAPYKKYADDVFRKFSLNKERIQQIESAPEFRLLKTIEKIGKLEQDRSKVPNNDKNKDKIDALDKEIAQLNSDRQKILEDDSDNEILKKIQGLADIRNKLIPNQQSRIALIKKYDQDINKEKSEITKLTEMKSIPGIREAIGKSYIKEIDKILKTIAKLDVGIDKAFKEKNNDLLKKLTDARDQLVESYDAIVQNILSSNTTLDIPEVSSLDTVLKSAKKDVLTKRFDKLVKGLNEVNSLLVKALADNNDEYFKQLKTTKDKILANLKSTKGELARIGETAPDFNAKSNTDLVKEANDYKYNRPLEAIIKQVASISGIQVTDMPKFVVDQNLPETAGASYVGEDNVVRVREDYLERAGQGALSREDIELLVHELRHGVQLAFGKKNIQQAAKNDDLLIKANSEESIRLGSSIERSVGIHKTVDDRVLARKLETDAYVFADRYSPQISDQYFKDRSKDDFYNTVGVGAGKNTTNVANTGSLVIAKLNSIVGNSAVDLAEEYQDAISKIESEFNRFENLVSKSANLDDLSIEEIEDLKQQIVSMSNDIQKGMLKTLQEFKTLAGSKEAKVREDIKNLLPQFSKKKELVPLAKELGIEGAEKLNKKDLIDRISNSDINAVKPRVDTMTRDKAQKQLERQAKLEEIGYQSARLAKAVGVVANPILKAGGDAVKGLAGVVKQGYQLAEGMEKVALALTPFGNEIKAIGKNVVLPMAMTAATTHYLPGASEALAGGTEALSSLVQPLSNAIGGEVVADVTGVIKSVVPNVMGMQQNAVSAASGAIDALTTGATEIIVDGIASITAGKLVLGAGSSAINAVAGSTDQKALPSAKTQNALPGTAAKKTRKKKTAKEIAESLGESVGGLRGQIEGALEDALKIEEDLSKAYQEFKAALKGSDKDRIQYLGSKVRELADKSAAAIDGIRQYDFADEKQFGSKVLGVVGGIKGRATQKKLNVDRELAKKGIEVLPPEEPKKVPLRQPISFKKPQAEPEYVDIDITEEVKQLNSDTLYAFEDIVEGFRSLISKAKTAVSPQVAKSLEDLENDLESATVEKIKQIEEQLKEKIGITPEMASKLQSMEEDLELNATRKSVSSNPVKKPKTVVDPKLSAAKLKELEIDLDFDTLQAELNNDPELLAKLKGLDESLDEYLIQQIENAESLLEENTPKTAEEVALSISSAENAVLGSESNPENLGSVNRFQNAEEIINKSFNRIEKETKEASTSLDEYSKGVSEVNQSIESLEAAQFDPEFLPSVQSYENLVSNVESNFISSQENLDSSLKGYEQGLPGQSPNLKIPGSERFKQELGQYNDAINSGLRSLGIANGSIEDFINFVGLAAPKALEILNSSLKFAIANIGTFGKIFAGVGALIFILPILNKIKDVTTQVAIEFQSLKRVINFTSGGSFKGADNLKFIRSEVNRLNTDLRTAYSSFASLSTASQGTSLEGQSTKDLFGAVSQAGSVYGLDPQKQERAFTALEQIISKGKLSAEELRGQLSEAIPGAVQIAARALGVTTKELNALLEQGAITSEEFIPKFSQQLKSETQGDVEASRESSIGKQNRFQNRTLELQEKVGNTFLPVRDLGLDVASKGIEALTASIPLLNKAMSALIILLGIKGAVALKTFTKEALLSRSGLMTLGATARTVGTMIGSAFKTLIIPFLVVEGISMLSKAFEDLSGDIGEVAKAAKTSVDGINSAFGRIKEPKQLGFLDRLKEQFFSSSEGDDGLLTRSKGELIRDIEGSKIKQDIDKPTTEILDSARETLLTLREQNNGGVQTQKLLELDKQIEEANRQRLTLNPNDDEGQKLAQQKLDELLNQREMANDPVAKLKQGSAQQIEGIKKTIEEYDNLLKNGSITQENYNDKVGQLKEILGGLESEQSKYNQLTKGSVDNLILLQREFKKTAAVLADTNAGIDKGSAVQKAAIAKAQADRDISSFEAEQSKLLVDQEALAKKAEANLAAIEKYRAILGSPEIQNTLSAFGLEGAGANAIRDRADRPELKDTKEASRLLQAADAREQLTQLETQNAQYAEQIQQARVQSSQALREANKAINEFIFSVGDSAEDLENTVETLRIDNKLQQAKNSLRQAISGFSDRFLGGFVDNLIQIFELASQQEKNVIDARSKIQAQERQIRSSNQQANELRNQYGSGGVQRQGTRLLSTNPNAGGDIELSADSHAHDFHDHHREYSTEYGTPRDYVLTPDVNDPSKDNNAPIYSPTQARVRYAGDSGSGYGNMVELEDMEGNELARFAHLASIAVKQGDILEPGSLIGGQGATGGNYAVHLHLEGTDEFHESFARATVSGTYGNPNATPPAQPVAGNNGGVNTDFFSGGSNSVAARVVGVSEGTRLPGGGFTDAWGGHPDPGNGAWNIGSFSYQQHQGGASTPEEADVLWNQRSKEIFSEFETAARNAGLDSTNLSLAMNFLDLYGQSPLAATGQGGFLDQLPKVAQRGLSEESILQARLDSYIDPSTGRLDAPGFGNDPNALRADQQRRMTAVKTGIEGIGGSSTASGSFPGGSVPQIDTSGIQNAQNRFTQSSNAVIEETLNGVAVTNESLAIEARQKIQASQEKLRKGLEELSDQNIQQQRDFEDQETQAQVQTPELENEVALRNITRREDDKVRDLKRQILELETTVDNARNLIDVFSNSTDPTVKEFIPGLERIIAEGESGLQQSKKLLEDYGALFDSERQKVIDEYNIGAERRALDLRGRVTGLDSQIGSQEAIEMRREGRGQSAIGLESQIKADEINLGIDQQIQDLRELQRTLPENNAQYEEMIQKLEKLRSISLDNLAAETTRNTETHDREVNNAVEQSEISIKSAMADRYDRLGMMSQSNDLRKEAALQQQSLDFSNQVTQIRQMGEAAGYSAEQIQVLVDNASMLNDVKVGSINEEFNVLTQAATSVGGAFSNAFAGLISGSMSAKEALLSFVQSVLSSLGNLAAQMLTSGLMGLFTGSGGGSTGGGLFGGGMGGGIMSGTTTGGAGMGGWGGTISTVASIAGMFLGAADGTDYVTDIPGTDALRQRKDEIGEALRRETQKSGRRSVLATLSEGEIVLNVEKAQRYRALGGDSILGFAEGGSVGKGVSMPTMDKSSMGSVNVNVPVNIENGDKGSDVDIKRLRDSIKRQITEVIVSERRPGGALAR